MLGHETQHAAAVLLARPRSAGEVLGVHAEDTGNVDPFRFVVHAAVPAVRQERLGRLPQGVAEATAAVRRGTHRRATVRAAVDREVDARLGVVGPEDLVLDVVEADRRTAGDVPPALEEPAVARLPDGPDRVLLSDRVEGERVVGVDPVGEPVLLVREQVRTTVRRRAAEFGYELLQQRPPRGQTLVVDLAVLRDDLGQQAVPGRVGERPHVRGGAYSSPEPVLPA